MEQNGARRTTQQQHIEMTNYFKHRKNIGENIATIIIEKVCSTQTPVIVL